MPRSFSVQVCAVWGDGKTAGRRRGGLTQRRAIGEWSEAKEHPADTREATLRPDASYLKGSVFGLVFARKKRRLLARCLACRFAKAGRRRAPRFRDISLRASRLKEPGEFEALATVETFPTALYSVPQGRLRSLFFFRTSPSCRLQSSTKRMKKQALWPALTVPVSVTPVGLASHAQRMLTTTRDDRWPF